MDAAPGAEFRARDRRRRLLARKPLGALSQYRAINLHFHDLRHEGASRLLETGWPVHYMQHMLGPLLACSPCAIGVRLLLASQRGFE